METNLPSFFVLSLESHLMKNFLNTVLIFNEFIFVFVANTIFICDGEIYLLTYLSNISEFHFLQKDSVVQTK